MQLKSYFHQLFIVYSYESVYHLWFNCINTILNFQVKVVNNTSFHWCLLETFISTVFGLCTKCKHCFGMLIKFLWKWNFFQKQRFKKKFHLLIKCIMQNITWNLINLSRVIIIFSKNFVLWNSFMWFIT